MSHPPFTALNFTCYPRAIHPRQQGEDTIRRHRGRGWRPCSQLSQVRLPFLRAHSSAKLPTKALQFPTSGLRHPTRLYSNLEEEAYGGATQ
eukprot:1161745-Pelagomonas_calceolata.AAC.12